MSRRLRRIPVIKRAAKMSEHAFDLMRMQEGLRKWNADVIHYQQPVAPVIEALLVRRLTAVAPMVSTIHNAEPLHGEHKLLAKGYTRYLRAFAHHVVHTDAAREHLQRMMPRLDNSKITIIRPAIYSHYVSNDSADLSAFQELSAKNERIVLLFGNIREYKGYTYALQAFSLLSESVRSETLLVIAGNPTEGVSGLRRLAAELNISHRIRWITRFIDDDELNDLFKRADIVLAPHVQSDLSGILMVALNYHVAVVATALGSFAEYLEDGVQGRLVSPRDSAAMAHALEDLLGDPSKLMRCKDNLRDSARDWPTWQQVASQHESLYRAVISNG